LEERLQVGGLVAPDAQAFVELPHFHLNVVGVGTKTVDAVAHAQNQAGEVVWWMGRMGRNVKVKVCFLLK
jgi:hypothetical protein